MKTLEHYLDEAQATDDLKRLLLQIAAICAEISGQICLGALADIHGDAGTGNVQGEKQKKLDLIANELFVEGLSRSRVACGLASEEMDHAVDVPGGARLLAAFDPLDGSSNIDVNVSIGSIFSVLPAPAEHRPIRDADFLIPGSKQIASGYAIYGPGTELVITIGQGVYGFTLDLKKGFWFQTKGPMRIPEETQEFAINASNARHWHPPIQSYINELLAGRTGPRGKDFNMRWIASMVADVHRILCRGGVFLYPADQREPDKPGKLRLLYEANPMALLVSEAGGKSTNGMEDILTIQPATLHQRVAVVTGAGDEVARVASAGY
ncbi:Fbp Fructose-1,6-bisphosphatase [Burkholderiales bacterium]